MSTYFNICLGKHIFTLTCSIHLTKVEPEKKEETKPEKKADDESATVNNNESAEADDSNESKTEQK